MQMSPAYASDSNIGWLLSTQISQVARYTCLIRLGIETAVLWEVRDRGMAKNLTEIATRWVTLCADKSRQSENGCAPTGTCASPIALVEYSNARAFVCPTREMEISLLIFPENVWSISFALPFIASSLRLRVCS